MTPTQRAAALRLVDNMNLSLETWIEQAENLLRELLAEPVQDEPVAWLKTMYSGTRPILEVDHRKPPATNSIPVYAAPQQQAEPVQEPVAAKLPAPQLLVESAQGFVEGWTRSQVRSAINLALLKRRYAAPQQPMRCPEDGGACGAGGYCRPETQQRKPLTEEQIDRLDVQAIHGGPDSRYAIRFARAIERAHGITGEPT